MIIGVKVQQLEA